MVLTKSQIQKLAAEVLQRYEEKYGAAPLLAPTVSVQGNTTRTNLGRGGTFSIKPTTQNSMGSKPSVSDTLKPSGTGLGKGMGGKGAKL